MRIAQALWKASRDRFISIPGAVSRPLPAVCRAQLAGKHCDVLRAHRSHAPVRPATGCAMCHGARFRGHLTTLFGNPFSRRLAACGPHCRCASPPAGLHVQAPCQGAPSRARTG